MENQHASDLDKPQKTSYTDRIASRIKLIRRSCTRKRNLSKYVRDLYYTDESDIDPDYESTVLSSKKPKFTFNKLKNKKRSYRKRDKSLHTSSIIDLSKGVNNHKSNIIDGTQQLKLPINNGFYDKNSKHSVLIDATNKDTLLPSSHQNTSNEIEDLKEKIPRPPNAFMIFANEWRKHLARQYPQDSNKTISVRLGQHWKILDENQKKIYYRKAKRYDSEHKKKYPDYQYNPKEARIRKAQRDAIKVAQRQAAASAVPLHQPPGYSPLSNTSRLDMNSTSPMQQFIPAYTSQQTLGQNVGSISGGGIINAGASTSLGSRPSALTLSNTTSRRPPPPAYPGLPRQQSFHHGLEPNHREYGIVYGEPNFNPLPNMYSNNQNISTPSESHTTGMFDSQYQSNAPMESGMWNGMSHSSSMWNPQNFDIQRQHSLNDYSPFQSPTDQHSRNHLIPTTSTATTGNNLDDPNMFNHSDFPTDFPSKITAEAQKKVLDLVVANDYITMPKLNSRLSIAVPHNYGIFNHTIASPTFYDLNFMNYYYQISLNSNNNNDIPILRTCFESQNKIFTTPNAAIKYHGGIFQQVNPGIMSDTQNSSSEDINNNSTLFQDKEENDNQVMSTTLISSTNGIIDITDDDAINTNIANGNLSKQ